MAQTQIFYIGTSKIKEIRMDASVTFDWGKYGSWTKFKTPIPASKKKVAYNKAAKNKINGKSSGYYGGLGGVTRYGTTIPATETRIINGVERVCEVRYYVRGFITYTRTSSLRSQNKMLKQTYTKTNPYYYRVQYKDKAIKTKEYSRYEDGVEYIYFGDEYFDSDGVETETDGHMMHPVSCTMKYSDCRRNLSVSGNNSERDNSGTYVMDNVRANIVSIDLEWNGLPEEDGIDLLDTLNPSKDSKGNYNYLIVQYLDPATGKAKNGTFYASERTAEKYANGMYKSIKVSLMEV